MTTTIRPVSTMVLIGLQETNTIGYYALFDFPMWPWSFVGLSLTYFPPSFTSTMGSPVFNK